MPLADLLGLAVAIGVTGQAGLAAALYGLAVLIVLAVTGLQRLRICLRVADQAGRILAAVALPLLILLPWMPATAAARRPCGRPGWCSSSGSPCPRHCAPPTAVTC